MFDSGYPYILTPLLLPIDIALSPITTILMGEEVVQKIKGKRAQKRIVKKFHKKDLKISNSSHRNVVDTLLTR